jgi:hypothetical protein
LAQKCSIAASNLHQAEFRQILDRAAGRHGSLDQIEGVATHAAAATGR